MTAPRVASDGPAVGSADSVVLPVDLKLVRRFALVRELAESAPAAIALIAAGVAGIAAPDATRAGYAIAVAQLASSAWMLLLLRRSVGETLARTRGGPVPDAPPAHRASDDLAALVEDRARIEWSGVAGAAMLAVEAIQHWMEAGRLQRPVVLLAAFTLVMAVGGRRALERAMRRRVGDRRPRAVISAAGVDYRATRRRRWTARWDDVARVEQDAETVRLTLRDGTVREIAARAHVDGHRLVAAVRRALNALAPARLAGLP